MGLQKKVEVKQEAEKLIASKKKQEASLVLLLSLSLSLSLLLIITHVILCGEHMWLAHSNSDLPIFVSA